jgi:hypothetical protein
MIEQVFTQFFRRMKVSNFLKHYLDFRSPEKFSSHKYNHEIKSLNNAINTFDLIKNVGKMSHKL